MAEDVTLGLGGILGESTNLKPLNDRPFTRAAQQELSLGLKAKADEAKLAKEKEKVDREFLNIVKPISTGDEIADRNISTGYADLVRSKGYTNPLKVQEFHNYQAAQQRNAKDYSTFRANLDKIVLDPKEEKAFRDNDNKALAALATDPSSNVTYDQETERFVPKNNWARMDLNRVHKELTNFDAQTPLNLADMKTTIINGDKYSSVGVDPKYKAERLSQLVKNDDYAANFYNENKGKVNAELANTKGDIKQAIYNTMDKVLTPLFRVQKTFNAAPKGGSGGNFSWSFGGGGGASNGEIELEPVTGKAGARHIKYVKGKNPQLKQYNIDGKDADGKDITVAFSNIPQIQKHSDGSVSVTGAVSVGTDGKVTNGTVYDVKPSDLQTNLNVTPEVVAKIETPSDADFDKRLEARARAKVMDEVNKYRPERQTQNERFNDPEVTKYIAYKPKKQETKAAETNYGKRNDGSEKGNGYFGALKLPNGNVATEYSVGTSDVNGKEMDIPTLVPTLTEAEKNLMIKDIIPNKRQPPQSIMVKAIDHARKRLKEGKSVYADKKAETKKVIVAGKKDDKL